MFIKKNSSMKMTAKCIFIVLVSLIVYRISTVLPDYFDYCKVFILSYLFRPVLFHHAEDPVTDNSPRISVRTSAGG